MHKVNIVRSKRLSIIELDDVQMRSLVDNEGDPHMKQAYGEMLCGCLERPKDRKWFAAWSIVLRDGTVVGDLCFKGPPENGAIEIGYGINEAHQNKGYATEAVEAMMNWAFRQRGVYFFTAEAESDNAPSLRVLEKLGFKEYGMGEEGPRFYIEKPPARYTATLAAVGAAAGAALDLVNNPSRLFWLPIVLLSFIVVGLICGYLAGNRRTKLRNAFLDDANPDV